MTNKRVTKRRVFFIGGYEPITADNFFSRMTRELKRFEATWDATAVLSPSQRADAGHSTTAWFTTNLADNRIETEFTFLALDDIVLADFAKPIWIRLGLYLRAFFDNVITGTLNKFFMNSWRVALFFLYPPFLLAVFACIAIIAATLVSSLGFPGSDLAAALIGIAVFVALLRYPGDRLILAHLMDLWSFLRSYVHRRTRRVDSRIKHWAQEVATCACNGQFDEILLIGHSTGGALILDVAATAFAIDSPKVSENTKITILTVGSIALSVGLHPAAGWFRTKVQKLSRQHRISWVEYQALEDVINFYKTDPFTEMKLESDRKEPFPIVEPVRIRKMLQSDFYNRIMRNYFRVHYQFIMANDRRYKYDFCMICFGPFLLSDTVRDRYDRLDLYDTDTADS